MKRKYHIEDFDKLEHTLTQRMLSLESTVNNIRSRLELKIEKLESRVGELENRVASLEKELSDENDNNSFRSQLLKMIEKQNKTITKLAVGFMTVAMTILSVFVAVVELI